MSDLLGQALLLQARQPRRESAQSRLAAQMLAGMSAPANMGGPLDVLNRASAGIFGTLMAQRAAAEERAREKQDMGAIFDYQRGQQEEADRFFGRTPAQPQAAPGGGMGAMTPAAPQQLAPQPSTAGAPQEPRGIRNNNPLNLEASPFTQQQPGFAGSDGRFGRFNTMEEGIAAADRLLQNYAGRGLNTVSTILNRWAPPSENNTGGYAATVARSLGVDPNAPLPMDDPAFRRRLIDAMAVVENGRPLVVGGQQPGAPETRQPGSAVGPTDQQLLEGLQSSNPLIRQQAQAVLQFRASQRAEEAARRAEENANRETFSAPQAIQIDGRPVMAQVGNRGTVRVLPNAAPVDPRGSQPERDQDIILRGDPSTPEYAMAFNRTFGARVSTNADGSTVTIEPLVPEGIRRPTFGQTPAPQAPTAQAAPALVPGPRPNLTPSPTAPVQPAITPAAPAEGAPTAIATPGGTVTRTPPTRDTPLTESQARANMFGLAMSEGHRIIGEVNVPSNAVILAYRNAPESLLNMALSENDQQYFNAVRQFAAGILRRETGAAFTNSELADVQSRFFPMPGDTLQVRQQKARARLQAIEGMRAELPGGFRGQLPLPGQAPAPSSSAAPSNTAPRQAPPLPPGNWELVR